MLPTHSTNLDEKLPKRKRGNRTAEIWRRFKQNKLALFGLTIVIGFILIAVFADAIVDYDENAIKISMTKRFEHPSKVHPFGLDELGRDVFARVIHGTRVSLTVGAVAVTFSLLVGGSLGAIAGYYGGGIENLIMRASDILQAIPHLLLAITIVSAFGQSMPVLMIAVGLSSIPAYIRDRKSLNPDHQG